MFQKPAFRQRSNCKYEQKMRKNKECAHCFVLSLGSLATEKRSFERDRLMFIEVNS